MKLELKPKVEIQEEPKINNQPLLIKYVEEWLLYPNGDLHFKKKYPTKDSVTPYHKQKKLNKEFFVANEEEVEEDFE